MLLQNFCNTFLKIPCWSNNRCCTMVIRGIRTKTYELIPAQYEESTETYTKGIHKGEPKPGRLLERAVVYRADFAYIDCETGKYVVEDTKGFRTPEYILKRKMLLYIHGIKIKEI